MGYYSEIRAIRQLAVPIPQCVHIPNHLYILSIYNIYLRPTLKHLWGEMSQMSFFPVK